MTREITVALVQMIPTIGETETNLRRMNDFVDRICQEQPVDLIVCHRRLPLRRLRWQGRHPARTVALARPTLRAICRLGCRPLGDAQRQCFRLAGEIAVARWVVAICAGMQAHRCGPG